METAAGKNKITLLFDTYHNGSRDLLNSFQKTGYDCTPVVIEDDGFLPDNVTGVYGFFLGSYPKGKKIPGRPRYFNEITVPDYWEISGNNRSGKICDKIRERGRIFYAEPKNKRLICEVDWLDEKGVVRSADHYNRYGALYARTLFDAKGGRFSKTYFSAEGREILVENYRTRDIILNEKEKTRIFRTKTDLVLYFLKKAGLSETRLFFNSLSTPFFVSQRMEQAPGKDILFWQEPVGDEIPGNMKIILENHAARTLQIMVQRRDSYEKLLALGAPQEKVKPLGFVYPFRRENKNRPDALICTNSENVARCRELAELLPGVHFHIAALTEMSTKLMEMGRFENVSLYPTVRRDVLEELFADCDYYLDINHEAEIVSAVRRAFLEDQLILAFRETIHNTDYIAPEHIFAEDLYQDLAECLGRLAGDHAQTQEALARQRSFAMAERAEAYSFEN